MRWVMGRGRVLAVCVLVVWIYVVMDASDVVVMTVELLGKQLRHGRGEKDDGRRRGRRGWQEPTRGSGRGLNGEKDLDELSSERRHAQEAGGRNARELGRAGRGVASIHTIIASAITIVITMILTILIIISH